MSPILQNSGLMQGTVHLKQKGQPKTASPSALFVIQID